MPFQTVKGIWILCFILAVAGCKNSTSTVQTPQKKTEIPDQEGWNSILTLSKEQITLAIIRYGHMKKFTRKKMVFFDEGVDLQIFKDDGTLKTHLVSKEAELNEATNDMIAIGDVVVIDTSGTLQTQKLHYIDLTKRIYSDEPVMMYRAEGDTIYGDGFEMDETTDRIHIKNPTGILSKGIDIKSAESQFLTRKTGDDTAAALKDTLASKQEPHDDDPN
ncbi:LPS export ABC transporter periplasmic protein LptC [candidate division KSB1 bacterium]|nr:LPS export ABC transporter periplasmic protein LptC [candidate division KSB1 bacterium]